MRSHAHSGRHRGRASQHSPKQVLVAAVLATVVAMGSVVAVAATGLAAAFLAGALTAVVGHRLRQRTASTLSVARVRSTRSQG